MAKFTLHRLDRETSGLVLLAKDPKTAAQLAGQFERREVDKEYIVIVEGGFIKRFKLGGFLRKDEVSCVRKKLVFETHENYKEYGKDGVFFRVFTCFSKWQFFACESENPYWQDAPDSRYYLLFGFSRSWR